MGAVLIEVSYLVIDIVRNGQLCQLAHQSSMSDSVKGFRIVKGKYMCIVVIGKHCAYTVWSRPTIAAVVEPDGLKANRSLKSSDGCGRLK